MIESNQHTNQDAPKKKKGVALAGVNAGSTGICTVGHTGNDLHYRGYDILELAKYATFEEVAYLLIHGELPNSVTLTAYKAKLKTLRSLPVGLKKVLREMRSSDRIGIRVPPLHLPSASPRNRLRKKLSYPRLHQIPRYHMPRPRMGDDLCELPAGRRRWQHRDGPRFHRHAVAHEAEPGGVVFCLAQGAGILQAEFLREHWRILRAGAEGDNGADIAEDSVLQGFGQLRNVLVDRDK